LRGQTKHDKNQAAEHNNLLRSNIFYEVLKKRGDRKDRRKYSLDTLKYYLKAETKLIFPEYVKDAKSARAELRKYFKRGTNTV
jgi:hypothetical protein